MKRWLIAAILPLVGSLSIWQTDAAPTVKLLALGCVLGLFLLAKEVTDSAPLAGLSTMVLGAQFGDPGQALGYGLTAIAIPLFLLVVAVFTSKAPGDALVGVFIGGFLLIIAEALPPNWPYEGPTWMSEPAKLGSTILALASLATSHSTKRAFAPSSAARASPAALLTLASLACYARYERRSATRVPSAATATDVPATKSSASTESLHRWEQALPWLAIGLALALALLASPHTALSLPLAALGLALSLKLRGLKVRWGWVAAFGLCWLAIFRLGAGDSSDPNTPLLLLFVLPGARWYVMLLATFVAFVVARRRLPDSVAGWAMSVGAALPLSVLAATLGDTVLPYALRDLLFGTMALILYDHCVSAMSRPAIQAPPRPSPAPGSLPRP